MRLSPRVWANFTPLVVLVLFAAVRPCRPLPCPRSLGLSRSRSHGVCECMLDRKGRRMVGCYAGGGEDPLPLPDPDPKYQVEVLVIAPPPDNPNSYTMGPIFSGNRQLEELTIVYSNVPAIGVHSLYVLDRLHLLNLTHNNISALLESNFIGLSALRELHLSDNRIESVPSSTFHHLPDLRTLNLARNRIRELSARIFFRLSRLHELDLSRNPLLKLNQEVFKDVPELRVLRCRGCGLSNVNKTLFDMLPDLEILDFGDNRFMTITSDDFNRLHSLRELLMDGNTLGKVPVGAFRHNTQLQRINLARNHIEKVADEAFLNVSGVRVLDLSYNRLTRLHAAILEPLGESLRALVVSGNALPLEELARVLRAVPHVTALDLADMQLGALPPGMLAPVRELRALNISGNKLTILYPTAFDPVPHLELLDASRNHISGLDEQTMLRLDRVDELVLHDNYWYCDRCHLPPLLSRVMRSAPDSPLRALRCEYPYSLGGQPLAALNLGELGWCSGGIGPDSPRSLYAAESQVGLITSAAIIAILVLMAVGLIAAVVYSRLHADYYYTHEEQLGPEHEAIFENMGAVLDDRLDCKKTPKRVTIATIDELTKDPELHALTNGSS